MPIYKLSDVAVKMFSESPELAMNVQLSSAGEHLFLILGSEIAVSVDSDGVEALAQAFSILWGATDIEEPFSERYETWRNSFNALEPQTVTLPNTQQQSALVAFAMPTAPYVPAPPPSPAHVFGHLPFVGSTTAGDKFLRFEPWPSSRRLSIGRNSVAVGTFAAPLSEKFLVPNGFAAVGRYAMPNFLPACTVWQITPSAGTQLAVGTSVPLYGQSGGGAEVCFTKGALHAKIHLLRIASRFIEYLRR